MMTLRFDLKDEEYNGRRISFEKVFVSSFNQWFVRPRVDGQFVTLNLYRTKKKALTDMKFLIDKKKI